MRLNNILQIITYVNDNTEIQKQFLNEINNKKQSILDAEKCRYNKDDIEKYKK